MYNIINNKVGFHNQGISQKERKNTLLDPVYFSIDEFNLEEFVRFIMSHSENLAYFSEQNKLNGDWHSFFDSNTTFVFLRLKYLNLKELRLKSIEECKNISLVKSHNKLDERHYLFLFEIIDYCIFIESMVIKLNEYRSFKNELIQIIKQNLSTSLYDIVEYLKSNRKEKKLDSVLDDFNDYWIVNSSKADSARSTNSLEKSISNAINSFELIKKIASNYYDSKIANSGKITPHVSLLITFQRIYQYASKELNKITDRHLEFYFKDILQLDRLKEKPNRAFLNLKINDFSESVEVLNGDLLTAGSTSEGNEILYEVINGGLITQANLNRIIAVELNNKYYNDDILALSFLKPEFYFLNKNQMDLRSENQFGFSFSSKYLNLEEGHRKLEFSIKLKAGSINRFKKKIKKKVLFFELAKINEFISNLFIVSYSSEEGWVVLETDLVETRIYINEIGLWQDTISISVLIPDTHGPISKTFNKDLDEESPPEFKFLINPIFTDFLPVLSFCQVENIEVDLEILDVKNLLLSNDFGILNQEAPFAPFGSIPVLGSSFYIGHTFLFNYPLSDLKLNVEWYGLPLIDGGFEEHYHCYPEIESIDDFKVKISALKNKMWFPDEEKQIVNLFQVVPEQEENTISKMRRINEIDVTRMHLDKTKIHYNYNDTFSSSSISGFLKLELCYPFVAFGHDIYPNIIRDSALKRVKKKDYPHPNEPYTPMIKEISCDLRSRMTFDHNNNDDFSLKHIYPFGSEEKSINNSLIPDFKDGSTIFIGIDNFINDDIISILFKFNDGIVSDEIKITFSIYDGEKWSVLDEEEVLEDNTSNFKCDGIVKLNLKKSRNRKKNLFNDNNCWIKISSNGHSFIEIIDDISLQAVMVECISQNLLDNKNIESGRISSFVNEKDGIDFIIQKYPSFGGQSPESKNEYYLRISERLRHKDRCFGVRDYEKIILQQFPNVHRCICFNHRDESMKLKPGNVLVILIPSLKNINETKTNALFSSIELNKIRDYINKRSPNGAVVNVINPSYEKIRAKLNVKFNKGYDPKYYIKKLELDIKSFISPNIYLNDTNIDVVESIQSSRIIYYIENLIYVDHILNFSLFHIVDGVIINQNTAKLNSEEIRPTYISSILISDDSHDVTLYNDQDVTDKSGVNEMMVETDYIVDEAESRISDGLNYMVLGKNYRVTDESVENIKEKSNFMFHINLD